MKIRSTISNDLDLDKCYPDHDAEHLRGFSHQLDTLDNANAGSAVSCLIIRKYLMKMNLIMFGKLSR